MAQDKKDFHKGVRILVVLGAILALAFSFFAFASPFFSKDVISENINKFGIPFLSFISFLLEFIPPTVSPIVTLSLAIIAGMNPALAISIVILGSTIGSFLGFYVGKKYMYKAVDLLAKKESAEKLTRFVNKYGKIIIPIAAFSPLPYLPVVIGAMNFSKRNFIIYGLIPRIASFIVYGLVTYLFVM